MYGFCNISIVLHFSKINKILYFYVDKHTIYGIIISGRETVEARELTPRKAFFITDIAKKDRKNELIFIFYGLVLSICWLTPTRYICQFGKFDIISFQKFRYDKIPFLIATAIYRAARHIECNAHITNSKGIYIVAVSKGTAFWGGFLPLKSVKQTIFGGGQYNENY